MHSDGRSQAVANRLKPVAKHCLQERGRENRDRSIFFENKSVPLSCAAAVTTHCSTANKRQQISIDLIRVGRRHSVRKTRVRLERGMLQELPGYLPDDRRQRSAG
jgi:hypothetical protein